MLRLAVVAWAAELYAFRGGPRRAPVELPPVAAASWGPRKALAGCQGCGWPPPGGRAATARPRLAWQNFLAAVLAAVVLAAAHPIAAAAAPPSAEAQATLRQGYKAAAEGLLPSADDLLSKAVLEWQRTDQAADEVAALFKARAAVRQQIPGRLEDALVDLDAAVKLLAPGPSGAGPGEQQRTYVLRARVNAALRRWPEAEADYSAAISRLDELDAIEATNPFLYAERSAARARLGRFAGAADDALAAEAEFKAIGSKIRALNSSADAALALYGAGDVDEAVRRMTVTFSSNGNRSPATNNPDDIGLLQELSRREAELHLAYAAHLFSTGDEPAARKQWETGCVRLEAFVQDGLQRKDEELELRKAEAQRDEASGTQSTPLKASSVAGSFMNTDLVARLNGMDPNSPFVTQRPQSGYIWYKTSSGAIERRDVGTPLAEIDAGLSCARFRSAEWLAKERPEWPPALRDGAEKYAAAVPQGSIIMPPKSAQVDRSQCTVLLGRPGLGDAVPCF